MQVYDKRSCYPSTCAALNGMTFLLDGSCWRMSLKDSVAATELISSYHDDDNKKDLYQTIGFPD